MSIGYSRGCLVGLAKREQHGRACWDRAAHLTAAGSGQEGAVKKAALPPERVLSLYHLPTQRHPLGNIPSTREPVGHVIVTQQLVSCWLRFWISGPLICTFLSVLI